jgi:transposase-like protein
MPITVTNPFKGRQHPGEVILQAVRWYLRYPLAYEHVAELLAEQALKWMPVVFGVGCKSTRRN